MNIPIFPLPVFLLPQGITRLRIFEARYLKMVRLATQQNGFAILLHSPEQSLTHLNWASWVNIINFDQAEDGMLIIDVQCKQLINISNLTQDADKLHYADIQPKPHWSQIDEKLQQLSEQLQDVFNQNPDLKALYQNNFNSQANWTVCRWLEILPIALKDKHIFAQPDTYHKAKDLINTILLT